MANIVDLLIGLGIDATDYAAGLDGAARHADGFVGNLKSVVGPAIATTFAAGAAEVGAFAVTSIDAAANFEAGMLNFASVTGSAIENAGVSLQDFQGLFLRLGSETAFSAAQAQEAAMELAKGGVAIPSIMKDATSATLDLASAGGLELAEAAGIVAKQLGVWADQGVTATDVSNLLAQAANASTVDVDELAAGLANVQGTAETVGVEYKDLVQSMALLAPNFASASTAGTSLNNMLIHMQPTTAGATEAMTNLGLITASGQNVFFDAQGNFLGMANAAEQLRVATEGLSEAEKTHYLQTIFGNDAMGAAVALAAAGESGFIAMGEAMAGAGTAAEQAALKNQGFKFAVDSLFGSIETLQIIVGSALLPILTDLVNTYVIPAVNAFSEFAAMITSAQDPIFEITNLLYQFSPLLGDLVGYFLIVATEGDTLNDFFVNLPAPVQIIISALTTLADVIGNNLQPILIGVAAVLGGAVVLAIGSMIASLAAVVAPIALAIGVAAALYEAYNTNFLGIATLVDTVINGIAAVITAIMTSVQAFWAANGASIASDASTTWQSIQSSIQTVISAVDNVIRTIMSAVLAFWNANGADILNTALTSWQSIQRIISGVVDIIATIIKTVLGAVAAFWSNHKDLIIGTVTAMWQTISGLFTGALQVIEGLVQAATSLIHGDLEGFRAGAEKVVQGLFTALEAIFKGGLDLLKGSFDLALEAIRDLLMSFVGDANSLGGNIINGIIDGVKGGVGALIDAVQDAATSALDAAKAALGIASPSKEGYYIGAMFMQGPIDAIYDKIPTLEQAGRAIGSALTRSAQPGDVALNTGGANGTAGAGGALTTVNNNGVTQNFDITAVYREYQDERTLRDTIRMESMLNAPVSA